MKIKGTNKDVKNFLKDLPVQPDEKVKDFVETFHDHPELTSAVSQLYSVKIELPVPSIKH